MSRRWKVAAVFVACVAAAQLVVPDRANPTSDARRSIHADSGTPPAVAAVLDRSCGACHSNGTAWPWYSRVAPASWVMVYGVKKARHAVNFSEWAGYAPEQQRALRAASCSDVSSGKMPGSAWTMLHPEARLSDRDVATLCAATRQARAEPAR